MPALLPLFLTLTGRRVLLVGAGPVAAAKLGQLLAAGADVRVVAPEVDARIELAGTASETAPRMDIVRRAFVPSDLDDAWLVVAAATPDVNRQVAAAAETRRIFVNAVDDPPNASAFLSGVVRRDGVTIAISTSREAPALIGLLRDGLAAILPADLQACVSESRNPRALRRRGVVPDDE